MLNWGILVLNRIPLETKRKLYKPDQTYPRFKHTHSLTKLLSNAERRFLLKLK